MAIHPTKIVKSRKMMTPTPRRLIPIYFSGRMFDGMSGSTTPSTQPASDQSSQMVSPIGAMTTMPVRKLERSLASRPGRRWGS